MGARNSAVVVDLPRCGPMLSPRVPNLVPIPGPRIERETPGQRPRSNYGHPQAASAAWLLSRAEAASSSIIESVRPSARGLAAAEADLSTPGDEPFWDDEEPYGPELETLRHAQATDHALAIAACAVPRPGTARCRRSRPVVPRLSYLLAAIGFGGPPTRKEHDAKHEGSRRGAA